MSTIRDPGPRDTPGWYGKIATLGDFAQRRLPVDFVQQADAWLSKAMQASREQLGERWLATYLTAPVLRCAFAPGVFDASWWFAVLMPSCDNVGRYFPLLVAQRRDRAPLDRIALNHLEAWFDRLAAAATQTLDEAASVEAFEQALHDAPPWPTPGTLAPLARRVEAAGEHFDLGRHASLHDWFHALAVDALQARFSGCSLWWHGAGAGGLSHASVVAGLPDPRTFADLLSGA